MDFQVLPHVVDAQGYARLFKVCKMWELEVAEQLLLAQEAAFGAESYEVISPSASVSGEMDGHGHGQVSTPSSAARRDRASAQNLFIRTDLHMKPSQVRPILTFLCNKMCSPFLVASLCAMLNSSIYLTHEP